MPSFGPGSLFTDLATVTINFAAATVGQAEFGTCLLLADDFPVATRTATYTNAQEVAAALVATDINAVIAAKLTSMLGQTPAPSKVKLGKRDTGAVESMATAMAAIIAADPDFYAFVIHDRTTPDIIAANAAVQALEAGGQFYISISQSADGDFITAGKPAGILSEERAIVIYHDTDTVHCAENWAAMVLAFDADETSAPWPWQSLSGVAAYATPLTAVQAAATDANFCNRIGDLGSSHVAVTYQGLNLAGRPISHVLTADLIRFRTSERVAQMVIDYAARGVKLTVDANGQSAIEGELEGLGIQLIAAGHIKSDQWSIVPQTISAADLLAARLRFVNAGTVTVPLLTSTFTYNLSTADIAGSV